MINSIIKECAFAGIENLDLSKELDKAVLAHICRLCKDLNVSEENLNEAFYFNRTGKYEQFLNKESYIKTYGKISVNYVSEVIMCYKKYLIAKNREIKPFESALELPISEEAEKEALKKGFELAKEKLIEDFKKGKSEYELATKWMHEGYYCFFKNEMNLKEKNEFKLEVAEIVKKEKIKEYRKIHGVAITESDELKYALKKSENIESICKCVYMAREIIMDWKIENI